MLVVGLTGGIASGKTTVSDLFAERGVAVIDADVIGRQSLDPDQPGYQLLVDRLGEEILNSNKAIDRKALRNSVFNQPELKLWLEENLHPLIYQACEKEIAAAQNHVYALLVVPLLFETNFHQLANRFCVIDCPADVQLDRLMRRDDITRELAEKMINSQMTNDARLARADDVISNSSSLEHLSEQVNTLHKMYVGLAEN